ncbi:MAG: SPOR domain-containing protein [Novosphingobium sp.]
MQALPNANRERLSNALTKLGRNPRNIDALTDAGDAARGLGDFDAAIGFYRRAEEVAPGDARVKAGLARAYVMTGDPLAAISYFTAAEKAGAAPAQIADDRGLAYDLVGDNAAAQRYYAQALAAGDSDEVRMRLALSQAIEGDQKASEATLMPLLRKQDKPGWRARAFALAIDGNTKRAVDITETILPPKLAESVAPYMRYMPRLTRAQQAAAANLGRFPRASEIGQDDPRIAAYVPTVTNPGIAATADPQKGASRSAKVAARKSVRSKVAAAAPDRMPPPDPKPAIESTGELPPLAESRAVSPSAVPVPSRSKPSQSAISSAAAVRNPAPVQSAGRAAKAPVPGFDLGSLPASGASGSVSPPAAKSTPAPVPSLSAAFADLGKPVMKVVPASGAVDIRQIEPARPKPKVEAKPKKPAPPAHPSRIWVQIGVGRDKKAIAFDWRRYIRQEPALFKGRKAYVSEMGRTNRILAGPFETRKAANDFIADLRKAGINGALPWVSPAGQVVDVLPVG